MIAQNRHRRSKFRVAGSLTSVALVTGLLIPVAAIAAEDAENTPQSNETGAFTDESAATVVEEPKSMAVHSGTTTGEQPLASEPKKVLTSPVAGWSKIDGHWYHFKSDGALSIGWMKQSSSWYYMDPEGRMATGWLQLGNDWYYFNGSGAMTVGWAKIGSSWFYFNGNGTMRTGWSSVGGSWYYFNDNGGMVSGWLQLGNDWYYFNGSGTMATGLQLIGTTGHRFSSGGVWIGYADLGQEVASYAISHVGKRYVNGAVGPNAFDCSGLVQYVYQQVGIGVPRNTWDQIRYGQRVSNPRPGDIVVLGGGSHVGIYISPGIMVDAGNTRVNVSQRAIYATPTAYIRFT